MLKYIVHLVLVACIGIMLVVSLFMLAEHGYNETAKSFIIASVLACIVALILIPVPRRE